MRYERIRNKNKDERKEAIPDSESTSKNNFSLTSSLRLPYGGLNKNVARKQIKKLKKLKN